MANEDKTGSHELPDIARNIGNYVDGRWEDLESAKFICRNPSNGEILAKLPISGRDVAQRAIAAATTCQKEWARSSQWERADLCAKLGAAIKIKQEELARVLSLEQGKPLAEARAEVELASHGFHMAAEQVRYMTGDVFVGAVKGRQVMSRRHPRGVYAVVTPWNFPVNIPVEYIAPGIATGNAIVWVPAQSTSLVAIALMRILDDAGFPAGLINLVIGEGACVGDEIVTNPGTHAIGFTGSTATGQVIAKRGAGKPMTLELGGNGPLIVRHDADLEKAAAAAAIGAFSNCGQICSATGRVLADRSIASELASRIAALAGKHVVGNPMEQGTTMGPLNNAAVARKVREHVEEAIAAGAQCLAGGEDLPHLGSDLFYAPTVLTNVTPHMRVANEETFGPVVPVIPLDGDDELLRIAKEGGYGLSIAIFSKDVEFALAMAEELSAGITNINESTFYWETHMPFGGSSGSASGTGRIGGLMAIEAMTEVRTMSIGIPDYRDLQKQLFRTALSPVGI